MNNNVVNEADKFAKVGILRAYNESSGREERKRRRRSVGVYPRTFGLELR